MKISFRVCFSILPLLAISTADAAGTDAPLPATVEFNRHIRPILSDNCFSCHGPDQKSRKAKLRLDTQEGAIQDRDGIRAVVPGDLNESELIARITTDDPDDVMPPKKSERHLTPGQITLLKRWVEQGAKWEAHWSFLPAARPALPSVSNEAWVRNEVDRFILARLDDEKLLPSPEADRPTLIRRVSFDLTGLPPTPAEVDAFLADESPEAYEKVVDRLLSSPRYGERMALHWLDLARYADTHGYHLDSGRDMWLWRDWVINAFNANQPYDHFTIEQLAGDLLPHATSEQKLATGFNRNSMINFEGGAIAEEYLTQYIIDRVATTSTTYLGLTMACAQCHDHKFDPVSQKEFYQFYSFFNAVPEKGLDGSQGNAVPFMKFPKAAQQAKLDGLHAQITAAEESLAALLPQADRDYAEWEKTNAAQLAVAWTVVEPLNAQSRGGSTLTKQDDGSLLAGGINPERDVYEFTARTDQTGITAFRLEALRDASLPDGGPGRHGTRNFVLTNCEVEAVAIEKGAEPVKVTFSTAKADFEQKEFGVEKAIDNDPHTGWAVDGGPKDTTRRAWFYCAEPIGFPGGTELRFRLSFNSQFGAHSIGRPRVAISSNAILAREEPAPPPAIADSLASEPAQRSDAQKEAVQKWYRENVSIVLREANATLVKLRDELAAEQKLIPTSMVMEEMNPPRDTFVLIRGQYNQPGEKVDRAVPASLPPLPPGAPPNRLGLAQWLVDPGHPLMARVTVNRFWKMVMGTGLVKTAGDFGSQGEWPSHPELLDWLATEFSGRGWDVKATMRLLVTSATYRQLSRVTSELLERDPQNRLYARGPRFRLGGEEVRDNALFVSGLMTPTIGGPSVRPYQPPGLWEELSSRADSSNWSAQKFVQSHGEDLYRRSIYTFWKRTSPPPSLATFDAPDRETCTVSRDRTNTPLQALVLMNDPTFVEASRLLAERMMTQGGATPGERIAFAFRLATARSPTAAEQKVLSELFHKQLARFSGKPEAPPALLSVGEWKRNEQLPAAELAAWTAVANMILNLDETVTRG